MTLAVGPLDGAEQVRSLKMKQISFEEISYLQFYGNGTNVLQNQTINGSKIQSWNKLFPWPSLALILILISRRVTTQL